MSMTNPLGGEHPLLSQGWLATLTPNRDVAPGAGAGELDLPRAARTLIRCARVAGLSPLPIEDEATELVRAFEAGDDEPFARWVARHAANPGAPDDPFGPDETLVLCALLAAREQWAGPARIVEPRPGSVDGQSANNPASACCPVCGSLARLELLLGEFGERHAVCPACDALWRIPRIGCPHCGASSGGSLTVYRAGDRAERALVRCRECGLAWRRVEHRQDRNPPPDLFLRAGEPWEEELELEGRENVRPVPLRPRRNGSATTP